MADESSGVLPAGKRSAVLSARGAAVGAGVALAAAGGALVARDEYAAALLVAAAAVAAGVAFAAGVVPAALVVLTLGLPFYDSSFATLGSRVGLLSVVLPVAFVLVVLRHGRDALVLRSAGWRGVALAAVAAVIALSVLVGPRGDSTFGLAKTYAAVGFLLPLTLALALAPLSRRAATILVVLLAAALGVAAVAGAALSVLQIARDAGYPIAPGDPDEIRQFVGTRAVGLSENPNTWAAFLVLPLTLLGALAIRTRNLLAGAALVAILVSLGLTGSRSAWIAAAVGIAVLAVTSGRSALRLSGRTALALAVVVVAAAAGVAFAVGGHERGRIDRGGVTSDYSTSERYLYLRAELHLGARHPLRGVGLGNIGTALDELPPRLLSDSDPPIGPPAAILPGDFADRHSAYFGLFAEQGVLGVAAILVVLVAGFATIVSARRGARTPLELAIGDGLLAALAATAAVALFADADRQAFLWWVLGVALGFELALRAGDDGRAGSQPAA
jgi:O-antigen ligase